VEPRVLTLVLSSVAISATAQLLLKSGATSAIGGAPVGGSNFGANLIALLVSPSVLAGLALYAFGALIWMFALAKVELSLAYPFVGLGFILTCVLSAIFLGEAVTLQRVVGTLLIAGGCVLVARSA